MTWQPAGPQGVRDTQEAIVQLLGFTKETFLASSLLVQGAKSFASKDTSRVERCDLLMDGLGLTEYDAYRGLAEAERKAAEKAMLRLADRIEQDAVELERLPVVRAWLDDGLAEEAYADSKLTRAQDALDTHTEAWQQAQARSADRRAAEAEHEAAEKERRRLREQAEQADSARENIALNQARLAELADADAVDAAEVAFMAVKDDYFRYENQRARLDAEIRELRESEACPTCKRPYDDHDDVLRRIGWLKAELAGMGNPPPAPSALKVTRAREEMQERAWLEERISAWQRTIAANTYLGCTCTDCQEPDGCWECAECLPDRLAADLAALPPIDQAELDRIKQQGLEARAAVHEAQQQLDRVRADKTRAETEVERLTALEAKHADEKAQLAHAQEEAEDAAFCEEMCGRDGLPTWWMKEFAIPDLEDEMTRIVRFLGKPWEIRVLIERDKKNGEGTIAALDFVVVKENGVQQPYGVCSGGERMRIDLALMGAFLRLFRQRRNAHSDLFAIDEPEGLDAAGREMLVTWLHDLARTVPVVQLITHHTDLRDSFEQVVEVFYENGRSRILAGERAAELVTA